MSNAHFEPRFSIPDEETGKVFPLPEIPWEKIVGRLEKIALEIKSFDARLETSGLAAGWQSRCDMNEAVRALLLDGHLVDIGDLVLHDAGMDVRSPTHELTRAASALRARRTAMVRKAPWPISYDGLAALRGIGPVKTEEPKPKGKGRSIRTMRRPIQPSPTMPIRGKRTLRKSTRCLIGRTRFWPAKPRSRKADRTWSTIRIRTRPRMKMPGLMW